MYRALCLLALVVALPANVFHASAAAADFPDLSGMYQCAGQDGDGTNYAGKCSIVKTGDVYVLTWEVVYTKSPTPLRYAGVGIQTPTGLAASFSGPRPSVIAYELGNGGVLTGRWAIHGNRRQQPESLVPMKQQTDRGT